MIAAQIITASIVLLMISVRMAVALILHAHQRLTLFVLPRRTHVMETGNAKVIVVKMTNAVKRMTRYVQVSFQDKKSVVRNQTKFGLKIF